MDEGRDEEEIPQVEVLLPKNKTYPAAEQVYGPDVETIMQEEDTQALTGMKGCQIEVNSDVKSKITALGNNVQSSFVSSNSSNLSHCRETSTNGESLCSALKSTPERISGNERQIFSIRRLVDVAAGAIRFIGNGCVKIFRHILKKKIYDSSEVNPHKRKSEDVHGGSAVKKHKSEVDFQEIVEYPIEGFETEDNVNVPQVIASYLSFENETTLSVRDYGRLCQLYINRRFENSIKAYTDGSCRKVQEVSSIAYAIPELNVEAAYQVPYSQNTTSIELLAISHLLTKIEEIRAVGHYVVITDNLNCIKMISEAATTSLTQDIIRKIQRLDDLGKNITLFWVPSHLAIEQNEYVDNLATTASGIDNEEDEYGDEIITLQGLKFTCSTCNISYTGIKALKQHWRQPDHKSKRKL